jgi:hypothetical protein
MLDVRMNFMNMLGVESDSREFSCMELELRGIVWRCIEMDCGEMICVDMN